MRTTGPGDINPPPTKRAPSTPRTRLGPLMKSSVCETGLGVGTTVVNLGDYERLAALATPRGRGPFREQALEVLALLKDAFQAGSTSLTVTTQTVFLRNAADLAQCRKLFQDFYGVGSEPVTTFVVQPPCSGAAISVEAWAIGGGAVRIERFGESNLVVSYDNMRWVHCGGMVAAGSPSGVYPQATALLKSCANELKKAGSGMEHVVRTWFYLGEITEPEGDHQRYYELNRARADFYHDIRFNCSLLDPNAPRGVYPASTGIGALGRDLCMSCVALQTRRDDVFLLPLENPQQTPAYAYHPKYSPKSPKFTRAMALVLGNYVTTWISGTASIVNSESQHLENVRKQTEQTLENIEKLIAPPNFQLHGVSGSGATLTDLAKIRVYLKRERDYAACKAVLEERLPGVPAIYAVADVCRPELLVEIEGVAFSRHVGTRTRPAQLAGG